jgi:hypothetical protein
MRARVRARISYATVVSAISVFLLVAGGAAIAAGGLAKNSVGSKQLTKNSVTTAKLKNNSVTAAKIRKGAVSGVKFKDGAVGAQSLDLASTPYSKTVGVLTSSASAVVGEELTPVPMTGGGTYPQPAGEDDFYVGTFTGTVPPACEGPEREVFLGVWMDQPPGTKPDNEHQILGASFEGPESGTFTATAAIGPDSFSFQPRAPLPHTLTAYGSASCDGSTQTATIDSVEIRVVGTR